MSILIPVFTCILLLVSLFLILVVLAQKSKSDGGMGAAMGGGVAEATFGADTGNVLTKATINTAITFFVLTFLLYLGQVYQHKHISTNTGVLPTITAPATPASVPAPLPSVMPTPSPAAPSSSTPSSSMTPAPTDQIPKVTPAPQAGTTTPPPTEQKKP